MNNCKLHLGCSLGQNDEHFTSNDIGGEKDKNNANCGVEYKLTMFYSTGKKRLFVCFFVSSLSSSHEKATVALYFGRIRTRLGVFHFRVFRLIF